MSNITLLNSRPASPHVLMTLDAVGGVWRYAMDLASGLRRSNYCFTFVGFGPAPSSEQRAEAEALGQLLWRDAPLDWLAHDETELDVIPALLGEIAEREEIDLVHLNLPSQAAGLMLDIPVIVVSHSCVVTWFAGVRGTSVPPDWQWQFRRNREGFDTADAVVAPSRSHAEMLRASYGNISGLRVVHNGSGNSVAAVDKDPLVFAAGRWWDDGKNGPVLDAAAASCTWPVVLAGPQTGPNGQYLPLNHVEALGQVSHAEVAQRMARAAIVASPSLYEPFGLAPLEAARAGATLVLSDIPTYRELWDGAALFADAHDPQSFTQALNTLAADETLRENYALRASERSARYSLEAQAAAMDATYRSLLQPAHAEEAIA